jgi:hypothetical protein
MWHIAEWASVFMGDIYPYMLGSGATDLHRTGTLGLAKVNAIDDDSPIFPFPLAKPAESTCSTKGSTSNDIPSDFSSCKATKARLSATSPRLGPSHHRAGGTSGRMIIPTAATKYQITTRLNSCSTLSAAWPLFSPRYDYNLFCLE